MRRRQISVEAKAFRVFRKGQVDLRRCPIGRLRGLAHSAAGVSCRADNCPLACRDLVAALLICIIALIVHTPGSRQDFQCSASLTCSIARDNRKKDRPCLSVNHAANCGLYVVSSGPLLLRHRFVEVGSPGSSEWCLNITQTDFLCTECLGGPSCLARLKKLSRLKNWIRRFHGVVTKYLDSYLGWFRTLDRSPASGLQPASLLALAPGERLSIN